MSYWFHAYDVIEAGKRILAGLDERFKCEAKPRLEWVISDQNDKDLFGYWTWTIAGRVATHPFHVPQPANPPADLAVLREIVERSFLEFRAKIDRALDSIGAVADGGDLPLPEAMQDLEVSPTEGS